MRKPWLYVVDFACPEKILIVEVDREDMGWKVIRFTEKGVEEDADAATQSIERDLSHEFNFAQQQVQNEEYRRPTEAENMTPRRSYPPRRLVPRLRPSQREGEINLSHSIAHASDLLERVVFRRHLNANGLALEYYPVL